MNLYALADDFINNQEKIYSLIESGDITEEEGFGLLLDMAEGNDNFLDDEVSYYKGLLSDIEAFEKEIENLKARQKSLINRAEWHKNSIDYAMHKLNKTKLDTPRNRVTYRSSQRVTYADVDAFIERNKENPDLVRTKPEQYTVNTENIKKLLKAGKEIEGAWLSNCENIQIK